MAEPEPPAVVGLGGEQGGRGGGVSGIDGAVHRATGTDIESGPTDHHHDHREEEEQDDNNNELMDKLSKFILTLVTPSLPGARSTAMRFNSAATIFLLISTVTSLACVACTHLRLHRQWRRALVCASCASFVLVASLFLASLDLLLFAAAVSAAAIIIVTITAVAMGSSAAVDGDDGDDGGQSGPGGHLMVCIFDNCALYVTGGFVGLFFGRNYSNYLMKSSGLAGVVRVLWIALFLDMAIGIFVMAGIVARIQAITARARRFYYTMLAAFGLSVILFIIVMGFGQHVIMAAASPPTQFS